MAFTRTFRQLRPILAALARHKVATALIVLQVALTLAVASNALCIVAMRIVHMSRPTGADEAHLFVIHNGWKMGQNPTQINANIEADLDVLRHVAGVHDAYSSQIYPLGGYKDHVVTHLKVEPDPKAHAELVPYLAADEHTIERVDPTWITTVARLADGDVSAIAARWIELVEDELGPLPREEKPWIRELAGQLVVFCRSADGSPDVLFAWSLR